jgi:hypothetical protein
MIMMASAVVIVQRQLGMAKAKARAALPQNAPALRAFSIHYSNSQRFFSLSQHKSDVSDLCQIVVPVSGKPEIGWERVASGASGEAGEGASSGKFPLTRLAFASLGDLPSPARGEGKKEFAAC